VPWPLPSTDADLLALAKAYPFDGLGRSYLFRAGAPEPLPPGAADPALYAGRTPVVAHGSNRAPAQLRRKFENGAEIPVSRAWLHDYDVVYSAHVTRYGSIAANLHHAPGARVEVFVTWLTEAQLARMHETEIGSEIYLYGRMAGVTADLEAGPEETVTEVYAYLSRRGCLAEDGAPIGLAAVPAAQRPHGALHQPDAIDLVRGRHSPHLDLDAHILETIRDHGRRRAIIEEMQAHAVPLSAPHFTPIDV
jgi:hypothetical protein